MKATMKKRGRRLGPFQLGRRCKHAAAELGHILEANNPKTGAPVLVVMPGPRRAPRQNWQARVSFQTSPPLFALEMEQAPASGNLKELANLMTLLLAALDAVEGNARTRAHLTREPLAPSWLRRPPMKALAAVGLAVLALGGGLVLGAGARSMGSPTRPPSTPGVGELADAGPQSTFWSDGAEKGPMGIAYPLPDKPFSNQLTPPCRTQRDEVDINGGCWMALERRPPCNPEQAEYQGKCYIPMMKTPRAPQSLSP
jgi:hypothetical protein